MDRQTDRQTDGQTTCDRKTALCTIVHRAVKTTQPGVVPFIWVEADSRWPKEPYIRPIHGVHRSNYMR